MQNPGPSAAGPLSGADPMEIDLDERDIQDINSDLVPPPIYHHPIASAPSFRSVSRSETRSPTFVTCLVGQIASERTTECLLVGIHFLEVRRLDKNFRSRQVAERLTFPSPVDEAKLFPVSMLAGRCLSKPGYQINSPHVLMVLLENGDFWYIWGIEVSDDIVVLKKQNYPLYSPSMKRNKRYCTGISVDPSYRYISVLRESSYIAIVRHAFAWNNRSEFPVGGDQANETVYSCSNICTVALLNSVDADNTIVVAIAEKSSSWTEEGIFLHTKETAPQRFVQTGPIFTPDWKKSRWPFERPPVALLPLGRPNTMLAVQESVIALCTEVHSGAMKTYPIHLTGTPTGEPLPTRFHPAWVAASVCDKVVPEPIRGRTSYVYVGREDGLVIYIEIKGIIATVLWSQYVGVPIGPAFSSVSVPLESGSATHYLFIAPVTGSGVVLSRVVGEQRQTDFSLVEEIPGWAPVLDACVASSDYLGPLRDLNKPSGDKFQRDQVIVTTGRQPFGAISILRSGIELKVGAFLQSPVFKFCTGLFSLVDKYGGRTYIIANTPTNSFALTLQLDSFTAMPLPQSKCHGLCLNEQTLDAETFPNGNCIQITPSSINLGQIKQTGILSFKPHFSFDKPAFWASISGEFMSAVTLGYAAGESCELNLFCFFEDSTESQRAVRSTLSFTEKLFLAHLAEVNGNLLLIVATKDGSILIYQVKDRKLQTTPLLHLFSATVAGIDGFALPISVGIVDAAINDERSHRFILCVSSRQGHVVYYPLNMTWFDNDADSNLLIKASPGILLYTFPLPVQFKQVSSKRLLGFHQKWMLVFSTKLGERLDTVQVQPTDLQSPEYDFLPISCASMLYGASEIVHGLDDTVIVASGSSIVVGSLGLQQQFLPRRIRVPGSPTRVFYSKYFNAAFVASIHNQEKFAHGPTLSSTPDLPRVTALQGAIHLISTAPRLNRVPEYMVKPLCAVLSHPVQSADAELSKEARDSGVMSSFPLGENEHVVCLREWIIKGSSDKPKCLIIVGTKTPPARYGEEQEGRLLILQARHKADKTVVFTMVKEIKAESPVRSAAILNEKTIVYACGDVLKFIGFSEDGKTLSVTSKKRLPFPVEEIHTHDNIVYILGFEHPIMALRSSDKANAEAKEPVDLTFSIFETEFYRRGAKTSVTDLFLDNNLPYDSLWEGEIHDKGLKSRVILVSANPGEQNHLSKQAQERFSAFCHSEQFPSPVTKVLRIREDPFVRSVKRIEPGLFPAHDHDKFVLPEKITQVFASFVGLTLNGSFISTNLVRMSEHTTWRCLDGMIKTVKQVGGLFERGLHTPIHDEAGIPVIFKHSPRDVNEKNEKIRKTIQDTCNGSEHIYQFSSMQAHRYNWHSFGIDRLLPLLRPENLILLFESMLFHCFQLAFPLHSFLQAELESRKALAGDAPRSAGPTNPYGPPGEDPAVFAGGAKLLRELPSLFSKIEAEFVEEQQRALLVDRLESLLLHPIKEIVSEERLMELKRMDPLPQLYAAIRHLYNFLRLMSPGSMVDHY